MILDARLEIVQDKIEQRQTEVIGIPRADTQEIGEIAGIDALQFEFGQFGEGLASWSHDDQVGETFEVLPLGGGKRQRQQSDKGDNRSRAPDDSNHGTSVSKMRQIGLQQAYFTPEVPFQRPFLARVQEFPREVSLVDHAADLQMPEMLD